MIKRLVLAFTVFLCALVFNSCVVATDSFEIDIKGSITVNYPYIDTYYDITEPVSNLNIDWCNGIVSVSYHDENFVRVYERTTYSTSANEKLQYYLENDTLSIYYNQQRRIFNSYNRKCILVYLPRNTKLESLNCLSTSASVLLDSVMVNSLYASATSGNITGIICGNCTKASVHATSGNINISGDNIQTFDISSTSGNINYASGVLSNSGSLGCNSGNIIMSVPRNTGFNASVSTTSGRFSSEVPLTRKGIFYTYLDGGNLYSLRTTSGNIKLLFLN